MTTELEKQIMNPDIFYLVIELLGDTKSLLDISLLNKYFYKNLFNRKYDDISIVFKEKIYFENIITSTDEDIRTKIINVIDLWEKGIVVTNFEFSVDRIKFNIYSLGTRNNLWLSWLMKHNFDFNNKKHIFPFIPKLVTHKNKSYRIILIKIHSEKYFDTYSCKLCYEKDYMKYSDQWFKTIEHSVDTFCPLETFKKKLLFTENLSIDAQYFTRYTNKSRCKKENYDIKNIFQMKNLKNLKIKRENIVDEKMYIPNTNKFGCIYSENIFLNNNSKNIYPNIEYLEAENTSYEFNENMINKFVGLKTLKMIKLMKYDLNKIQLSNLKTLICSFAENFHLTKKTMNNFPSLVELNLTNVMISEENIFSNNNYLLDISLENTIFNTFPYFDERLEYLTLCGNYNSIQSSEMNLSRYKNIKEMKLLFRNIMITNKTIFSLPHSINTFHCISNSDKLTKKCINFLKKINHYRISCYDENDKIKFKLEN